MNRREFLTLTGLSGLIPLMGWKGETDILDFVDSGASGIPYKLFPVQRFVLKMVYGLDLDSGEREYLDRLRNEGRYTPAAEGSKESVVVMGRRGGMSLLGTVIQLYETHKLLQAEPGAQRVLTLSPNKDQSSLSFATFINALAGSQLGSRVSHTTMSWVNFKNGGHSVRAMFRTSHAKSVRGFRSSSVVFDNAAFMSEQDFQKYRAAVLPGSNRCTLFTSVSDESWFRDFYHSRAQGSALTLRIPSWEANPLTLRYLREIARTPYIDFDREFGAVV